MERWRVQNNERGLTLVEILASLVILGIVFVGFMTVFPQMTNFNEKTGSKLETMNLARLELEEYKKPKFISDFTESGDYVDENNHWVKVKEASNGSGKIKYIVDKEPVLTSDGISGQVNLHKFSLEIIENSKIISETFGYVEVNY
ncbi:prepilin-type N-terminal cleavage/methylation domain-containing protein [Sporosarcina sp. Te-1]|uniref:type IV pilus modification PilV family protein n=1 Tax=Sporosarcina sp. Te-1 TaxID=2818390 RepID=UPI001A9FB84C|nr:type II secretion system protein [Sporosarcina sp. Te-1]QTD41568.1 type II secretion system protein [Sporosarcina sp. Te-1]